MSNKVDFVICWVDGSDPNWIKEKMRYTPSYGTDVRNIRYRDWELLRYWFRGVEQFAPWVNNIHFVTWGHTPSWLNTDHPKLHVVNHEDYIPKKYLPTFSARPIEVNLHRIPGLSEQFVYFNDDMFLLNKVNKQDFFKSGKPRDTATMGISISQDIIHSTSVINAIMLINKYFNKRDVLKSDFRKWINIRYGKQLFKTILLLPWKQFTGFSNLHLPNPFLKSTFDEVWKYEDKALEITSSHRFRESSDLTQYVFKFWQLASGNFNPIRSMGEYCVLGFNNQRILEILEKQKYKMVCLNDSDNIEDFDKTKENLINSFDSILPKKSEFEI